MPSDNIPAHQEVIVIVLSTLAFGVSLVTLAHCLRWLLFVEQGWKLKKHFNWTFLTAAILIALLNTLCLGLNVRSLVDRVLLMSESPFVMYHTPVWRSVIKCLGSNLIALMADATLMFRCWVMYSRTTRVVIFPILLWLIGWATTGMQMYLQIANIHDPKTSPYSWGPVNMSVGPGIALAPFWGTTVLLNGYTTFMLVYRLYQLSKEQEVSSQQLRSIMRIIAESGILYLSITTAHFLVWFGKSGFAIRVVSSLNAPIIGIAFHLTIIRVSQNPLVTRRSPVVQISAMKFTSVTCSNPHMSEQSSERSVSPVNFGLEVSSSGTVVESPKFALDKV